MKTGKSEAIQGFKAVEFMRKVRKQINEDTRDMNFEELKKYFEIRRSSANAVSNKQNYTVQ
ncbi:MAG: hypothetical protein LBQ70_07135 [Prevotellaceae bacterium]|jgi:hypothetical protein|nr:hypothetical protein [Prevotellaceae bacterium]